MVLALLLILFRDWSLFHTLPVQAQSLSLLHQEFFSLIDFSSSATFLSLFALYALGLVSLFYQSPTFESSAPFHEEKKSETEKDRSRFQTQSTVEESDPKRATT